MTAIQLTAPAKLTTELRVTGTRADGYHLIDAEMVSLSLADSITIDATVDDATGEDTTGDGLAITVTGPYRHGVPTDASNLVHRALELTGRSASVTIDKQIPHGGGLGGGSTDAAAVLRWADYRDLEAASRVGADIPFCMVGGRARVTGIGERIEPLAFLDAAFTLIIPPLHVSTPAVYGAYDELASASNRPTLANTSGVNDLEPAALAVEPQLLTWRDRIREVCGERPILAGSGATWFVHGRHGNALAVLNNEGAQILEASTVPAL